MTDHRHPLCPLADRLSPHRRGPHGAVQLALRARPRRQDAAADRGHRSGAVDRTGDRRDPGWVEMARARLGRRGHLPVQPRRAPPRGRRALLASGKAYRCYATPEELTAMREKARAEGRTRLYDGLWRDRDPSEAPRRHEADDPAQGAADRRDRDRGPGSGPRGLAEREPRRPRAAARRRQSDLHARRRGRRPRHGRHPHHSRRRSPDQRRAPEADLRCARLGHPQHVPHSR